MIEINLVPPQLRKRQKKNFSATGIFNLPQEIVFALIGGVIAFLIVIHVLLQLNIFLKVIQHSALKAQWAKTQPEKQQVDVVLNELRSSQNKINAINKVTTSKRLLWAQKFNEISESLPRGMWLNRLSLESNVFMIEGSAFSKIGNEMTTVGDFLTTLKNSKAFMEGLENIDVGSIQRRQIKSVDISDFYITIRIK